jgi:hypothetical protein
MAGQQDGHPGGPSTHPACRPYTGCRTARGPEGLETRDPSAVVEPVRETAARPAVTVAGLGRPADWMGR